VRGLRGRLRREGVEYDFSGHMSSLAVIRAAHSEFREGREKRMHINAEEYGSQYKLAK